MASTYTVDRSAVISASPSTVYAMLEDFHKWPQWSPWEEIDPNMRRDHSGAERGQGAVYAWEGNRKAGKGRMEVIGAEPDEKLSIKLDFEKPFKSRNQITFLLTPTVDGSTDLLWRMEGPRPLFMRVFGFVFNMDKIVGKDFEKGLRKLATAVRSTPTA